MTQDKAKAARYQPSVLGVRGGSKEGIDEYYIIRMLAMASYQCRHGSLFGWKIAARFTAALVSSSDF